MAFSFLHTKRQLVTRIQNVSNKECISRKKTVGRGEKTVYYSVKMRSIYFCFIFFGSFNLNLNCCLKYHHPRRCFSHKILSYCCFNFILVDKFTFRDTSPAASGGQVHEEKRCVPLDGNPPDCLVDFQTTRPSQQCV